MLTKGGLQDEQSFITHRLSSIKNSDLILVMHNGELVEQGTHRALVDKSKDMPHFIGSKMNDMNISAIA